MGLYVYAQMPKCPVDKQYMILRLDKSGVVVALTSAILSVRF